MTHSLKILLLTVVLTCLFFDSRGNCAEYLYLTGTVCNAIRQAEGNPNYGIINGSCDVDEAGQCFYMCREIVRIRYEEWIGKIFDKDFPEYLASRWAPIGVANDPTGLNRNFLGNLKYFLKKGEK